MFDSMIYCMYRYLYFFDIAQDDMMMKLIEMHGTKKWASIAAGLSKGGRTGKQVRDYEACHK